MDILVRKKSGGKWDKVSDKDFQNEAELQKVLYQSPDIIPFEKLSITKPILFIKEAGLPGSGNTDLIGVDEKGGITIIECKLAVNREIRRQVIGQVFEYAAYLWQMDYNQFDNLCCKAEKWTDKHLADIMRDQIRDTEENWSEKEFIDNLISTLDKGDFPLIIAVDALNDELKQIIQFLNSRGEGTPKIIAVEIKQFETSELQMLVPELFGTVDTPPASRIIQQWDEAMFIDDVKKKCLSKPLIGNTIIRLLDFTKARADNEKKLFGTGESGAFLFKKERLGKLVTIFTVSSNGSGSIYFSGLSDNGVDEGVLQTFRQQLNKSLGTKFTNEQKYPTFKVEALINNDSLNSFQNAVLSLSKQMESH